MRIVGGTLRGRPLQAPAGDRTRPTSDRIRQAVFNIIEHGIPGFDLEGAAVLDLFAGTGALGLEALSRGAATCLFVENDAQACRVIGDNIAALGLQGRARLLQRNATMLGRPAANEGGRQLIFLDPPYDQGLATAAIESALAGGWLADGALIVAEEAHQALLSWPPEIRPLDRRRWGGTSVTFAWADMTA